jgi:hypothetical protein
MHISVCITKKRINVLEEFFCLAASGSQVKMHRVMLLYKIAEIDEMSRGESEGRKYALLPSLLC